MNSIGGNEVTESVYNFTEIIKSFLTVLWIHEIPVDQCSAYLLWNVSCRPIFCCLHWFRLILESDRFMHSMSGIKLPQMLAFRSPWHRSLVALTEYSTIKLFTLISCYGPQRYEVCWNRLKAVDIFNEFVLFVFMPITFLRREIRHRS
jgi:hypothetical protein